MLLWAYSSVGSASVSLLCPTELWAFKWGVCRLVAQPRHAPKYGPIAQLGERSVRIREVKGSNPSRSTNLPHRFVRCGVFYAQKTLADRAGLRTLKSDANRAGSSMYFLKIHRFHASFFAFCRVLRASASLLSCCLCFVCAGTVLCAFFSSALSCKTSLIGCFLGGSLLSSVPGVAFRTQ